MATDCSFPSPLRPCRHTSPARFNMLGIPEIGHAQKGGNGLSAPNLGRPQMLVWIGGLEICGWFPICPQHTPGVQIQIQTSEGFLTTGHQTIDRPTEGFPKTGASGLISKVASMVSIQTAIFGTRTERNQGISARGRFRICAKIPGTPTSSMSG